MLRKAISTALLCIISLTLLSSCEQKYDKYQADFVGTFDTVATIVGYSKTQNEFEKHAGIIHEELKRLHKLYDIYNDYDGISNLKTINDNAGIAPVKVDEDIIGLLKLSKQAYSNTDGIVNIALGPVLKIWHDYRAAGIEDFANAKLPPMELLREAAANTNIDDLIIDEQNSTVFLQKPGMRLDVGAIAKGYATDIAVEAAVKQGMKSVLVSIGGNVVASGKPLDGVRDRWGIGIQDPETSIDGLSGIADTVYLNYGSVVTSGDYQRFYVVNGKIYHHIIDPTTLMPAERYGAVTVLHEDSAIADMLSTSVFILPEEQGEKLLEKHGASALWIRLDGSMKATAGYTAVSKELGNYSAVDGGAKAAG